MIDAHLVTVPSDIRLVDQERRDGTKDDVQSIQPRPRIASTGQRDGGVDLAKVYRINEVSRGYLVNIRCQSTLTDRSTSKVNHPADETKRGDRQKPRLDSKDVFASTRVDEQERNLHQPEEEVGNHDLGGCSGTGGKDVGDVVPRITKDGEEDDVEHFRAVKSIARIEWG